MTASAALPSRQGFGLVCLLGLGVGCEEGVGQLQSPCANLAQARPVCVVDPGLCKPLRMVLPVCVGGTEWRCEGPARALEGAPRQNGGQCAIDFAARATLGPEVPRDDGGCGLFVDADVTRLGAPARFLDRLESVEGGPCPRGRPREVAPTPGLEERYLDVLDVIRPKDGPVLALVRIVLPDSGQLFGVDIRGAALVPVDPLSGQLQPPTRSWPSPGYRSMVAAAGPGGEWLYMSDCFGVPENLLEDCGVAIARPEQAEEPTAWRYLSPSGAFDADGASDALVLFRAGPQHHLSYHPGLGRYLVVTVAPFGDTVVGLSAPDPAGPWSDPVPLHRCDLPDPAPVDPSALRPFCDTARLLTARYDPRSPGSALLTYRRGGPVPRPPVVVQVDLSPLLGE